MASWDSLMFCGNVHPNKILKLNLRLKLKGILGLMATLVLTYVSTFLNTRFASHLAQPVTIQPLGVYCAGASSQCRAVADWISPEA